MSKIYPIEIAETQTIFYPQQQSGQRWNGALERAHLKTYAICHCLADGNERKLAIKRVKSSFVFARYQETSHHHRHNCQFYGQSRTQSGLQGYTREAVRQHSEGGLAITLARGLQAPRTANENDAPPDVPRHENRGGRRNTMRLGGLLDLLWEEAGLNKWHPAKPKYWDLRVGTALLREAEKIHVGRLTLDQALLLPAQRSEKSNSKTIEHQRNLDVLEYGSKRDLRLIAISPLARFDPIRDTWGGRNPNAGMPEQVQEYQLRVGTPYGMPTLMLDAARSASLQRSYDIELAAWRNHKKVYAIVQLALRKTNPKVADILDISLLYLSERFIPLDSSYEGELEEALVEAQRSFIKPMRYEIEDEVFPDFWLQDMGCEYPLEVFGMTTDTYRERVAQKRTHYADREKYPGGWWYWDLLERRDIPVLPAPVVLGAE